MSKQRLVDTCFWDDGYIIKLDPSEKLLFLYLLTNPLTTICGVYEISIRRIAFDTGFESDTVQRMLSRFERDSRCIYRDGWVAMRNWIKHQSTASASVAQGIVRELEKVPQGLREWIDTEHVQKMPLHKKRSKQVTKLTRETILSRDGNKCVFCGETGENFPLQIDHIIPITDGGTNEHSNLRVLCQRCNGKRASARQKEEQAEYQGEVGVRSGCGPLLNSTELNKTESNLEDLPVPPSATPEVQKPKRKKAEPDPTLKPLVQYYIDKHKEIRGFEPTVAWPRDMKIMQQIRHGYKPEAIRQLLDMFFAWKGRSIFTLRAFHDKVDTLYGVLKDKAEGKR